jgi:Peptidase family M23
MTKPTTTTTELTATDPQQQKAEPKFSSITPGRSVENFLNYKPNRTLNQAFDSPRSNRPRHEGIDYGSKAGITKGSTITAVMGGIATPMYNWYRNSTTGVTDAGVRIRSTDSQGRTVDTVYGHLSRESVAKIFNGKGSISVNAGDVIGKVGSTGKDGGNEYHVHVDIRQPGKKGKINPLEYFKQEAQAAGSSSSTSNNANLANSNDRTNAEDTSSSTQITEGSNNTFNARNAVQQSTQSSTTNSETTNVLTGTASGTAASVNASQTPVTPSSTALTGTIAGGTIQTARTSTSTALTGIAAGSSPTALTGIAAGSSPTALTGIAAGGENPQPTQLQQGLTLS